MNAFPAHLLAGHATFLEGRFGQERDRYQKLAESGQSPQTMVIGCCDSRAAPELIFDASPGELFVARNVANLVPPFEQNGQFHGTSAALEFAVRELSVRHVVLLGHGRCGGIRAALESLGDTTRSTSFIGQWMGLLAPATATLAGTSLMTASERQTALERISIRYSIANLRTFPFVTEREQAGLLSLHGAWFDIALGELWIMEPDSGDFVRAHPHRGAAGD
jgi:carbonic anhydrase